ncbi:hypothetical protein BDU57DRAFT_530901 [Ampelomyces quisqualis]|uniref:Uncharacterized protein n=1 Tax=Ampelomyces quisqualis TaxID=50730 RepID=A0A6A5QIS1_AMPQU|nr:hypothetical protein BDU57DRAFT_530901 [Ampelomyces quisqualis]
MVAMVGWIQTNVFSLTHRPSSYKLPFIVSKIHPFQPTFVGLPHSSHNTLSHTRPQHPHAEGHGHMCSVRHMSHWFIHESVCKPRASAIRAYESYINNFGVSVFRTLDDYPVQPFLTLNRGTYLHRFHRDTFKLLIGSHHLLETTILFSKYGWNSGSTFSPPPWSTERFEKYLDKASECPNLLPSWWNETMRRECLRFGESPVWNNLRREPTPYGQTASFGLQMMVLFKQIMNTWTIAMGPAAEELTSEELWSDLSKELVMEDLRDSYIIQQE